MAYIATTELILLTILFVGLIIPEVLSRAKLPLVSLLILAGAIAGPYGFDLIGSDEVILFFAFLGSIFYMFHAGLRADAKTMQSIDHKVISMAMLNGIIPFIVGFFIAVFFGYPLFTSLFVGTLFISSSFPIIIAALKRAGRHSMPLGGQIVSAAMILDFITLVIFTVLLQIDTPQTRFPILIYVGLLIFAMAVMKMFVPEITLYFFRRAGRVTGVSETRLRYILVVFLAVMILFRAFGINRALSAFIAGFLLADVVDSRLYEKIRVLTYGLFIPVFFFVVGMNTDLRLLYRFDYANITMIAIVLGIIISKFASGYIGGRFVGHHDRAAVMFGIASTHQLTTTLAISFAGAYFNIFDTTILTAIVVVSLVTTFLGPIVLRLVSEGAHDS